MPHTDSIEERAQFWDAHDRTDFEEELAIGPLPQKAEVDALHIAIAVTNKVVICTPEELMED